MLAVSEFQMFSATGHVLRCIPEVSHEQKVRFIAQAYPEVRRLDITVYQPRVVAELYSLDHLVSQHEYSF